MKLDWTADPLVMRSAEEVATHGHGTAEIRESGVVSAALNGKWARNAMRGEVRVAVVDVRDDWAGDSAEFDVAVIGGDLKRCLECADTDVAMVGGNDGRSCCRQRDGEVGAGTVYCGYGKI